MELWLACSDWSQALEWVNKNKRNYAYKSSQGHGSLGKRCSQYCLLREVVGRELFQASQGLWMIICAPYLHVVKNSREDPGSAVTDGW